MAKSEVNPLSVHARYALIMEACASQPITVDSGTKLDALFKEHGIIVLPNMHSMGFENGTTEVAVTFTLMDMVDNTYVECRTIGLHHEETTERPTNQSVMQARQNGLVNLFFRDLVEVAPAEEKANRAVDELMQQTGVTTADKLPAKEEPAAAPAPAPKKPTKQELADQSVVLLNWQNKVANLSPDDLGEWDAHREELKQIRFIGSEEKGTLLTRMIEEAKKVGIDYDRPTQRFVFIVPA